MNLRLVALTLLAACHSESYVTPPIDAQPPFGTGPDIQITFNPDQDYWPMWTQDGRGILYAYVDRERPLHRCLGMLAPEGGTRLWQLCDNRAVRDDTASSYIAFAMDTAGRLLVAESVTRYNPLVEELPHTQLWLADTAHPYVRTNLLTLPATIDGIVVTWLADLQWTGPNSFIGIAQQFNSLPHCITVGAESAPTTLCSTRDTIFADAGFLVTGTIAGGHATLAPIVGTDSATSYSFAEGGASIVFTRHHDLRLFKIPPGGGVSVPLPIIRTVPDTARLITSELAGVSCNGSTCIVARDGIFLTDLYSDPKPQQFAHFFFLPPIFLPQSVPREPMELHRISLATNTDVILKSNMSNVIYATPQISPVNGDVVLQVGGGWGHLQTFATAGTVNLFAPDGNSVLRLMKGLVP